ncbi:MAG: hypothetical protein ABSF35_25155 [Polyangia bacterium]|jgi:hypothetical protein
MPTLNLRALDPASKLATRQVEQLQRLAERFDEYLDLTRHFDRSIENRNGTKPFFYPHASILCDIAYFFSCFSELFEIYKQADLHVLVDALVADPFCQTQLQRMVEADPNQKGYYWSSYKGRSLANAIPFSDFKPDDFHGLIKLLRNGPSHARWTFADLSPEDYFAKMEWAGGPIPSDFPKQPANNWTIYIADADSTGWPNKSTSFWGMANLRVLATPAHLLRYHLHRLAQLPSAL